MTLKDLPLGTRPRKKLLMQGAAIPADVALLALLARAAARGQGALRLVAVQVRDHLNFCRDCAVSFAGCGLL